MEEKEFKSYKEQQNYYKEKYKNRGQYLFAQPLPAKIYNGDRTGTVKPQKGKTYKKQTDSDVLQIK